MRVSLHTGLRVNDALSLKKAELKPQFWITEAKTGKKKRVNLPQSLLSDLKAAGEEHDSQWLFPGRSDPDKHRTRQAVWQDVKRAAKAFRLPQNVGPHSFRKVYAVDLMQRYGDIAKVRRSLNHSDFGTTMIYAMADQQFRAKFAKRRHRA
jgi:integrase family protein